MFAADLSWTDQNDEKVGERRVRKSREREGSIQSASTNASSHDIHESISSDGKASALNEARIQSPTQRPSYWGLSPFKGNANSKKRKEKDSSDGRSGIPAVQVQPRKFSLPIGDSPPRVGWTITTKLPSCLPSGGSIDPTELLQNSNSPPATGNSNNKSSLPFSPPKRSSSLSNSVAHQVFIETAIRTNDEVVQPQDVPPVPLKDYRRKLSVVSSNQATSSDGEVQSGGVAPDPSSNVRPVVPPKDDMQVSNEKPLPNLADLPGSYKGLASSSSLGTTTTIWSDAKPGKLTRRPSGLRHKRTGSGRSAIFPNPEPALSRKNSFEGWSRGLVKETCRVSPSTSFSSTDEWLSNKPTSPLPLTHFQGFICRMEQAGPRVVYDHLREERQGSENEAFKPEQVIERHLWVLTALHLKIITKKFLISGNPDFVNQRLDVRNVLEFGGNLAEVIQLSALWPDASVLYLSTQSIPQIDLPSQISSTCMPSTSLQHLPYPSCSLDLIRASTLPSLLPSAQIPALLAECHRILRPGGTLELRLLDPLPDRHGSGPLLRAWIEVRLLVNLELSFRCTRPSLLIPQWARDTGFALRKADAETQGMALRMEVPAANDDQGVVGAYVDEQVGSMVGRELWKDVWGGFVSESEGDERWWWENEGCLKEATERGTKWSISTLVAVKPVQ